MSENQYAICGYVSRELFELFKDYCADYDHDFGRGLRAILYERLIGDSDSTSQSVETTVVKTRLDHWSQVKIRCNLSSPIYSMILFYNH